MRSLAEAISAKRARAELCRSLARVQKSFRGEAPNCSLGEIMEFARKLAIDANARKAKFALKAEFAFDAPIDFAAPKSNVFWLVFVDEFLGKRDRGDGFAHSANIGIISLCISQPKAIFAVPLCVARLLRQKAFPRISLNSLFQNLIENIAELFDWSDRRAETAELLAAALELPPSLARASPAALRCAADALGARVSAALSAALFARAETARLWELCRAAVFRPQSARCAAETRRKAALMQSAETRIGGFGAAVYPSNALLPAFARLLAADRVRRSPFADICEIEFLSDAPTRFERKSATFSADFRKSLNAQNSFASIDASLANEIGIALHCLESDKAAFAAFIESARAQRFAALFAPIERLISAKRFEDAFRLCRAADDALVDFHFCRALFAGETRRLGASLVGGALKRLARAERSAETALLLRNFRAKLERYK